MQGFLYFAAVVAMPSTKRIVAAAMVTTAFTVLARLVRGVSRSGGIAGALCCFVLYVSAGAGGFAALVTVFALAWITTRLGYRRKQALGIAERKDGRSAKQVFANLGIAALCALLFQLKNGNPGFLVAMVAALSEAAADTVSSELGQAFGARPRLITSWVPVPAGTNGGVTPLGTIAGILAGCIVGAASSAFGVLPWGVVLTTAAAATAGMVADSYLGATFEQRRWLNNDSVNFLSTAVAAAIALLIS